MLKKILFYLLLTTSYLLLATISYALELRSPRFKLELDQLDIDVKKEKDYYTLANVYNQKDYDQFISDGYILYTFGSNRNLNFSINPSILTIPAGDKTITVTGPENFQYFINLNQEYALKNLLGNTLELHYRLSVQNNYRSLPNQNEGQQSILVASHLNDKPEPGIIFRTKLPSVQLEGTYETVINIEATTGY